MKEDLFDTTGLSRQFDIVNASFVDCKQRLKHFAYNNSTLKL